MFEEVEIFLLAVTAFAMSENLASGNVQSSKQRHGAVTSIVVGDSFDIAQAHPQKGLTTIETLDLAPFIHTQNHIAIWRV